MGNLCLCCYVRRENLKSQFSVEDIRQIDGTAKFLPKIEWTPEKESLSPTTVVPKTPSLTSSDVSTSILNSQPVSNKPVSRSILKVKDVHSITRARSAPVLHDVPDIIVTDHKGAMTGELSRRFENPGDEEKALPSQPEEEPSVSTDSFVVPSSMAEEPKINKTPSASPTLSHKSDGSTKSRQESAKEVMSTIATVGIASSILDSRRTHEQKRDNRDKDKDLKNFKSNSLLNNNRRGSRDERRARFEKDKRMMYRFGQSSSNKNLGKKRQY